jgi:1-aminocyclopropane-1-carboxylate deaminase
VQLSVFASLWLSLPRREKFWGNFGTVIQLIDAPVREKYFPGIASLGILRLDLPDPVAFGNKSRKLKYHLEAFRRSGRKRLLTFGGAYSNHIAAVALAGKQKNIRTIGLIRGEELNTSSNAVLAFAAACGMQLQFVSRDEYRKRYDVMYQEQLGAHYDAFIVPEGGAGEAGIRGCMEIPDDGTDEYDEIIVAVGTGTTLAGLIASGKPHQHFTGISVVSSTSEKAELDGSALALINGHVSFDHSLGGYAKSTKALEVFIERVLQHTGIPLDRVYTGKALFAVHNMVTAGHFQSKKVLFVHTGGYAFEGKSN